LILSKFGEVRVGPIMALPAVLSDLGVRPHSAFAAAKVDPRLFRDPDTRIPLEDVGRLLETCVELTGCNHFGLLLGARFDLGGFGPLGELLRNSPSIGDAVRSLLLHLHLHDRGAAPVLLAPTPTSVLLGYTVYRRETPAIPQIYDAAIAIAYRLLRELCGASWKPRRVQFSYRRPSNLVPYVHLFQAPVRFEAEVSGIKFASTDLLRPIEGADPSRHAKLLTAMKEAESNGGMSFSDKVQGVLHQMLLGGSSSADDVARLFGIHERTLRRRLTDEGKNLHELIAHTRFELAQQLLENTEIPVSGIAVVLRYEDPNAFSRAFRSWAGLSPRQWRVEHKPRRTDR
jgi:AraC-like DNA-binding protein